MTHIDPFNPHPPHPDSDHLADQRYGRSEHPSGKAIVIWAGLAILVVLAIILAGNG